MYLNYNYNVIPVNALDGLLEYPLTIIYNEGNTTRVDEVKAMTKNEEIPREIALKLCNEIRGEHKQRGGLSWFSIWRFQRFFCYRFAKGDVAKLCISNEQGCPQVNKRYELHEGYQ